MEEMPDNTEVIKKLLSNSKAAIIGAIELHNKPIFPYRYEVTIILTINAWELALKAYILKYKPEIKVFSEDWSKEFLNSLGLVGSELGKDFMVQKEGIEVLYSYRCKSIHFYTDGIELILYSLLRPNILYFSDFLLKYFEIDLADEINLIILPIGFKRLLSPVDFISKKLTEGNDQVKEFIRSIVISAEKLKNNGFEDGLICNYNLNIESVTRIKNADIIVGITNEPTEASILINKPVKKGSFTHDLNAPTYRIEEEDIFRNIFIITTDNLYKKIREAVSDFKASNYNKKYIREMRKDANYYRIRYLDIVPHAKSVGKGYYSQAGVEKAIEIFKSLKT